MDENLDRVETEGTGETGGRPRKEKPGRLNVGIIGAGKAGAVIGSALRAAGHRVVAVSATSEASLERAELLLPGVSVVGPDEVARTAQLVVVAVPDDQIEPVVSGFAKLGLWRPGQIVAHLSGAHGVTALQGAAEAGALVVALHPAMTFTGYSIDLARLDGCPWAVTVDALALPIAQALVVELGGEPFVIDEAARPLYHAALAHGANHLVTLVSGALQALESAGVEDPARVASPLLHAALERALSEGARGLTGPVVRGDAGTVVAHLNALGADPDLGDVTEAYSTLAQLTAKMAAREGMMRPDIAVQLQRAAQLSVGFNQQQKNPDN